MILLQDIVVFLITALAFAVRIVRSIPVDARIGSLAVARPVVASLTHHLYINRPIIMLANKLRPQRLQTLARKLMHALYILILCRSYRNVPRNQQIHQGFHKLLVRD